MSKWFGESLQNIGQDMGDPKRVPTGTGPASPMTFEVFRLGLSKWISDGGTGT